MPQKIMHMGVDNLEQMTEGLPDNEAVIKPYGRVGKPHFLKTGEKEKILEMAPVFGCINDNAVLGERTYPVELLGIEADVAKQIVPDNR